MKRRSAFLFAAVLLSVSCGSETAPDEHSPASARLFAAGQEITPNLVLARGQTVRIEVRFLRALPGDGAVAAVAGAILPG